MQGKYIASAILIIALIISVSMWWMIDRFHYETLEAKTDLIIDGEKYSVSNFQGIDAESSPLKLRACFTVEWDFELQDAALQQEATPLIAPSWFECFDAERLDNDIRAGVAAVRRAQHNEPFGFSTYIAYYQNGRGYLWRQINQCGKAQFAGQSLPDGCGADDDAIDPWNKVLVTAITGSIEALPIIEGSLRGSAGFACFQTGQSLGFLSENYALSSPPLALPQGLPSCFPNTLLSDVSNGRTLLIKGRDAGEFIAITADGAGYVWKGE